MNTKYFSFKVVCICGLIYIFLLHSQDKVDVQPIVLEQKTDPIVEQAMTKGSPLSTKEHKIEPEQKEEPKKFSFKFNDENLVDLINTLAEQKGRNVLLPNPADAITAKISMNIEEKMTLESAWKLLHTILDIAGYSIVEKPEAFAIVKNTRDVSREPLPMYINVPYEQLPDTDQQIRCMFYMGNIKVPADPNDQENELAKILNALMPAQADPRAAKFIVDPVTNALILSERASIVKSIMQVVKAIDQTGFKEKYEILPLFHTLANDVKLMFDEVMKTPPVNTFRLDARKTNPEATYFSRFVRIMPYGRLNVLIILGREQAVDRVKDFIQKYIDVAQDEGKSVFHVYDLQYLDAAEFAPILKSIVSQGGGAGSQARQEGGAPAGGIERYFEGVQVTHDKPDTPSGAQVEEGKAAPMYFGSNKLIIAARHDDWVRIKKLIEELDTPQPQVIIEVLIADLTAADSRALGTHLRNPMNLPFPGDVQAQSAMLGYPLGNTPDNPKTIGIYPPNQQQNVDLLRDAYPEIKPVTSIAGNAAVGTTAVSISDPNDKVWGLLEIRNFIDYRKVLSNPHVIAMNNKPTKISIGEIRLIVGNTVGGQGGTQTINKQSVDALVKIDIVPRISLSGDDDTLNDTVQLGITVDITDWSQADFRAGPTANSQADVGNRFKRQVVTTAHVRNQEVVPLGGLLRRDNEANLKEVPILGKIPILGYFFKNRSGDVTETNLTVFLCPTVVRPRLRRGGMHQYTRDYIKLAKNYSKEGQLFDSLKDPVTRWFFKTDSDVLDVVNDFISTDEFHELRVPTAKAARRSVAQRKKAAEEKAQAKVLKRAQELTSNEYMATQESLDAKDQKLKELLKDAEIKA